MVTSSWNALSSAALAHCCFLGTFIATLIPLMMACTLRDMQGKHSYLYIHHRKHHHRACPLQGRTQSGQQGSQEDQHV